MRIAIAFMLLLNLPALTWGMGAAPRHPTILLVPSIHSVVQLGRDFVDRENVLLMTYAPKTDPATPFIHAWSGTDWVRVTPEAFADGSFLRNSAARVIVVGEPNPLTARLIENSVLWCPEVLNLETLSITELVNAMGRLYSFRQSEWTWFARRYNLKLEDLNSEERKISWYDSHKASELPPPTSPLHRSVEEDPLAPPIPHPILMPQPAPATPAPTPVEAQIMPPLAPPEAFSFEKQ